MLRSNLEMRRDARQIWQAGVDAVRGDRLVREWVRVEGRTLVLGKNGLVGLASLDPPYELRLDSVRRIVVVGGGKAGAAMARAVEETLGPEVAADKQLAGWVNVPDNCVCPLRHIHLHPARPAGANEPTDRGAAGSEEILRLVASLGADDLCLCLISGGGSALLPAVVEGVTLADKAAVARHLSAAGANIEQLNTIRKELSRIKGGGLLRACRAGRLVSLVISDVLGDRLDLIASGPTVPTVSDPRAALEILERFHVREAGIGPTVVEYLERATDRIEARGTGTVFGPKGPKNRASPQPVHFVLGNNATAVAAAAVEAERLGYSVTATSAACSEGSAETVGRELAETALRMRAEGGRRCLISGGEPVVTLAEPSHRGLGGRNQQLALAALLHLADDGAEGISLLSGGTDGEDGPTDAAGALVDSDVLSAAHRNNLDPADSLARNDAYQFFSPLDALLKTGPTHTNVCDVRVVIT